MSNGKGYSEGRRNIALVFSILLGLAIGFFIKRVQVGLLIGLVIGLIASGLSRRK
jgi:uncharacterized membrane protein (UPF0136 family)